MATKSQHNRMYQALPAFLRQMREQAGLTQRQMGKRLNKPQSFVYNCETANRRVDITEFILWSNACEIDPKKAFNKLLKKLD
jgi:transcriptional regulator with XRE-family HTH domain